MTPRAAYRAFRSRLSNVWPELRTWGILAVLATILISNAWSLGLLHGTQPERFSTWTVAVGIDQDWRMFAPPPETLEALVVTVTTPDGRAHRWQPPAGRFDTWRRYHWHKVHEATVTGRADLAPTLARVAVDQAERSGDHAVRVQVVRRAELQAPLDRPDQHAHRHDLVLWQASVDEHGNLHEEPIA